MDPIKVYCADCGKWLYTSHELHELPDGPRYCIKCHKARLQGSPTLSASVEEFLREVVKTKGI